MEGNYYSHPERDDMRDYDIFECPECHCRAYYSTHVLTLECVNCGYTGRLQRPLSIGKHIDIQPYNMGSRPFDFPLTTKGDEYGDFKRGYKFL